MKSSDKSSILNVALSSLSILLIGLGLFFIYIGVSDIVKNKAVEESLSTDNQSIDVGISVSRSPEEIKAMQTETLSGLEKSKQTQTAIEKSGKWIATNYVQGDINKGEYIVKRGDTLWEIAEAVYGNGYEWKKILEKNKASIKKLPNGEQALIFPGQVLVID